MPKFTHIKIYLKIGLTYAELLDGLFTDKAQICIDVFPNNLPHYHLHLYSNTHASVAILKLKARNWKKGNMMFIMLATSTNISI